jgi:hypothetical protein
MRNSVGKTTSLLAALVLGLSVLEAAAPSYADNNGSSASPAFPPDGAVQLTLGAPRRPAYSAYYPSNPGHGHVVDSANRCAPDIAAPVWSATSAPLGYTCERAGQ